MQIVPLGPVLHFDLHAAILGWLLTAAQPKLHHPRGTSLSNSLNFLNPSKNIENVMNKMFAKIAIS
jgi:hypothetical protein